MRIDGIYIKNFFYYLLHFSKKKKSLLFLNHKLFESIKN